MQVGMLLIIIYTMDAWKSTPIPHVIHKHLPPTVGQTKGLLFGSLAGSTRYTSEAITILATIYSNVLMLVHICLAYFRANTGGRSFSRRVLT